MVLVPLLYRNASVHIDPEGGPKERVLDVMNSERVPCEEHIHIAAADKVAEVINPAAMHD